jgi:hypothetical protein
VPCHKKKEKRRDECREVIRPHDVFYVSAALAFTVSK